MGVVHLVAEASPDGRTVSPRRLLVIDAETGEDALIPRGFVTAPLHAGERP